MTTLQDIIISRVRVKMFKLFLTNGENMYYVREITRLIKEEINAVRRELDRLLGCGFLKSEQRGNRLYYSVNSRYLYFQELQHMVAKSSGIGKNMRRLRRKLGGVKFVMFSGTFVRNLLPQKDQVEVLVIGDVVIPELEAIMKAEEEKRGREINYAVFSEEEFEFRKTRRDPFIMEILYSTRIMIIGNEDDFARRQIPGL